MVSFQLNAYLRTTLMILINDDDPEKNFCVPYRSKLNLEVSPSSQKIQNFIKGILSRYEEKSNKKSKKMKKRQIIENASNSKLLEKHAVDSEDDDVQRFSTRRNVCFASFANIVFTSLTNALTHIS